MSPMYADSGITNLVAQLNYGTGVTAGYRIHVDREHQTAKLQIGLTAADLNSETALFFNMIVDSNADGAVNPESDLNYYSQQTFAANIEIHDPETGDTLRSENVGMTLDTGASTTVHNTQLSEGNLPEEYIPLTDWEPGSDNGEGTLIHGLHFKLTGTTVGDEEAEFFAFHTNDEVNHGEVSVQNNRPNNAKYYLNTGISFFYQYDVIYNLEGGQIGIEAVPEPGTAGMCVMGAVLLGVWLFSRRRKVRETGEA
jgi:PEP-CTERM motif